MVLRNHNYSSCFFGVLQFRLQIVQPDGFPHSHPFTVKCSFLTPRDQRDVFAVCRSIHVPAPSSLPSFLCPRCRTSPSSLRHESLTHTHPPAATILMTSWSCYPALDITLCFRSSLALTFGALTSPLAWQLLPEPLSNFQVQF